MQKHLKPLRLLVSTLMLLAVGFLFLDFSGRIPSAWFQSLTWLQFVPSLIRFSQTLQAGLALSAYGFIAIFILTLLFGRVYCSYICPLGILIDLLSWFSAKLRPQKHRFRFAKPKTRLRYSILVVVCLSLFTGNIFLLNLLDPYSNFGRFIADLLRPAYMLGNNLLVKIGEAFGSYAFYPITLTPTNPFALIVPVSMLVLIVWLSVKKGRLYCNTLCPVGTLLGLVSKASLYKVRFDAAECNRCGKCIFVCKSQCIDIQNREIDFSRCVGCGNCMSACDKSGVRYLWTPARKLKGKAKASQALASNRPTDTLRRHFILRSGRVGFVAVFGGLLSKDKNHLASHGKREVVAAHAPTPPGSLGRNHFTNACTACHLCVSACPSGVLKPSLFEYGVFGMMQPSMDFSTSFCNYECIRCTEICPNGAILPLSVEAKQTTQIGIVRLEKENCIVATEETSCGACSEHCPTQAVRMVPYKGELTIPEVATDFCVGCGACEYACPVTPYKAIVVDGLLAHKKAQKPEAAELEAKPLEEFPF